MGAAVCAVGAARWGADAHATGNLDCLQREKGLMRRVPTPATLSNADFSHNDRVSPFGVEIPTTGLRHKLKNSQKLASPLLCRGHKYRSAFSLSQHTK